MFLFKVYYTIFLLYPDFPVGVYGIQNFIETFVVAEECKVSCLGKLLVQNNDLGTEQTFEICDYVFKSKIEEMYGPVLVESIVLILRELIQIYLAGTPVILKHITRTHYHIVPD